MNFIDLIIIFIIAGILGLISYFAFTKKEKNLCSRCIYKSNNCNCRRK